jgi:hypothetical protein
MEMYRKVKMPILVLTVCIAFSVLSAETLIAGNYDHDCIGENCPVCLHIEAVKCFIRTFKLAGLIAFFAAYLAFFAQAVRINNEFAYYNLTPIVLKVRFNS